MVQHKRGFVAVLAAGDYIASNCCQLATVCVRMWMTTFNKLPTALCTVSVKSDKECSISLDS